MVKFCVYTKVARKTVALKTLNLDRGLRGNIKNKLSRCQGVEMQKYRGTIPDPKYPLTRYCSKKLLGWLEHTALCRAQATFEYNTQDVAHRDRITAFADIMAASRLIIALSDVLVDRGFDLWALEVRLSQVSEDFLS